MNPLVARDDIEQQPEFGIYDHIACRSGCLRQIGLQGIGLYLCCCGNFAHTS